MSSRVTLVGLFRHFSRPLLTEALKVLERLSVSLAERQFLAEKTNSLFNVNAINKDVEADFSRSLLTLY